MKWANVKLVLGGEEIKTERIKKVGTNHDGLCAYEGVITFTAEETELIKQEARKIPRHKLVRK